MFEFLDPWMALVVESQRKHFEDELRREICFEHVLHGKSVQAIAHSFSRDDVVFTVDGGPKVACVHLTYSIETDPSWPDTQLYDSIEEFGRIRMRPDHDRHKL